MSVFAETKTRMCIVDNNEGFVPMIQSHCATITDYK